MIHRTLFTRTLIRLMATILTLASSSYILLGTEQNASASVSPTLLILPTQTMITQAIPEVILRVPLDAAIEISDGSTVYGTGIGNDFTNVNILLPSLSKGIHLLKATIIVGSSSTHITLPPIIVDDNDIFDIQDIAPIAFNISGQAWDFNRDGLSSSLVDNNADIEYLLKKIQPQSRFLPIDDLAVVSSATTLTSATLTFSKPLGATNVTLLHKTIFADEYSPVSTNLTADSNTVTVPDLTPNTFYQFKLEITLGTKAGESNTVNVLTAPDDVVAAPDEPLYAMGFNGSTDYIEIAHDKVFNSPSFTIEAWVNQDSFGWKRGIVSKYQENNNASFTLRTGDYSPYNNINFAVNDGYEINSGQTLSLNTWYHIAAVYSNNVMTLYINGQLDSHNTNAYYNNTNSSNLTIGADFLAAPRLFDGKLGEVRYWSTARTESEIKTDMANHALTQTNSDLTGYWNFSDAANPFKNQSLFDGVSKGHNGTAHGTPTRVE